MSSEDAVMIAGLVRTRALRKRQRWMLRAEKKSPALEMAVGTGYRKRKMDALEGEAQREEG
jgi:hypothetical protein